MKRALIILLLVLFGVQAIAFAYEAEAASPASVAETYEGEAAPPASVADTYEGEAVPPASVADAYEDEAVIPASIINNEFMRESLRLNNLARLAYSQGNYLDSMRFSDEAIRYAELSNEYVLMRLRMAETDNAIAAARRRLTFAITVDAPTRYPDDYRDANLAFGEALSSRAEEMWEDAVISANRVLAILAHLGGMDETVLPAQYVVRLWTVYRDSLWDISGRAWAYNDPWQWRRLYDANRDIMPEPGNPDLIHPGMVLDIPPIRGEVRRGLWQPGRIYPSLPPAR